MSEDTANNVACSQCETPALSGVGLCVDHYLKYEQALYLQASMLASQMNYIQQEIYAGHGGILPLKQVDLPPPPFEGDKLTLNHIEITGSTVGVVNLGQAQNIDSVITQMHGEGNQELADALAEFTQAVINSDELTQDVRDELAEAIELLAAQTRVTSEKRSKLIPTIIRGVRDSVSSSAALLTLWDKLEPLLKGLLQAAGS